MTEQARHALQTFVGPIDALLPQAPAQSRRTPHARRPQHGSTVIGYAAMDGGLPVNDIVLVGGPGAGVNTAAELGVPADRVWVVEDNQDRIADLAWFGRDPSDSAFGANQVRAEPDPGRVVPPWEYTDAGHLDYFWNTPGTQQSHDNIGDIIAGRGPTHR